jgi:HlyD family secretion protein
VLSVEAGVGDQVSPGSPVLVLADLSRMEARATVTQAEAGLVEEGQPVILRFDAFPEAELRGRVLGIVPEPVGAGGVVTYAVPISLEGFPEGLLPGMTGDGEIVLAERRDVLVLPRRAIRARPNSTVTLRVLTDQGIELRTVRIGLVGELNAEILSGLEEGERVVVER